MNERIFKRSNYARIALIGVAVVAAFSAIVMLLWNVLVPKIFGLRPISFWQAAGLFVLLRILFGNFLGGRPYERYMPGFHGRSPFHEKWMKMTPEERQKFIAQRREFFHHGYMKKEGFCNEDFDGNKTRDKEQPGGE